jgi:hypothetical protein
MAVLSCLAGFRLELQKGIVLQSRVKLASAMQSILKVSGPVISLKAPNSFSDLAAGKQGGMPLAPPA